MQELREGQVSVKTKYNLNAKYKIVNYILYSCSHMFRYTPDVYKRQVNHVDLLPGEVLAFFLNAAYFKILNAVGGFCLFYYCYLFW